MDLKAYTLEEKTGQLFLFGFPEAEITDEVAGFLHKRKIGNVILFSHNITGRDQVFRLNRELRKRIEGETGIPPLIALDEEGGQVSRLPAGCAVMPSAMAQVQLADTDKIREGARIAARELKALGFNYNLAPVLDINSKRENPGCSIRSYGKSAEQVSAMAAIVLGQYLEENLLCCGKHFPGDGEATADTHLDCSVIHTDMDMLWKRELVPFRALIRQGLPSIMAGHNIVPAIDEKAPCSLSEKALTGLLREKLGFTGMIVTDCLEMNAIKDYYGVGKAAVRALKAGADLLCISHTPAYVEEAVREIEHALEDGSLTEAQIDRAAGHVLEVKRRFLIAGGEQPCEFASEKDILFAENFFREAMTVRPGEKAFSPGEAPLFLGIENVHLTAIYDSEEIDFAIALQKRFGGTGISLGQKLSEEDFGRVKAALRGKSSLVLGTFNGYLSPEQRKLMEICGEFDGPVLHVALRSPADLEAGNSKWTGLAPYEYTGRSIRAVSEWLRKYV